MAYFDKRWRDELIVDASQVGLGAVLTQVDPANPNKKRIICFASRSLTYVERRYSQCEKEALVVWGCERFWFYLMGQRFKLVTDNRAVQLIFNNKAARQAARIERWALRLTQFDLEIVHKPGASNIVDYFSRNPNPKSKTEVSINQKVGDQYINSKVSAAIPTVISRQEIAREARNDKELLALEEWISER